MYGSQEAIHCMAPWELLLQLNLRNIHQNPGTYIRPGPSNQDEPDTDGGLVCLHVGST